MTALLVLAALCAGLALTLALASVRDPRHEPIVAAVIGGLFGVAFWSLLVVGVMALW